MLTNTDLQLIAKLLDTKLDEKLDEKLTPIYGELARHTEILERHSLILERHEKWLRSHDKSLRSIKHTQGVMLDSLDREQMHQRIRLKAVENKLGIISSH